MIKLPATTIVNRYIPKEKFYKKTLINNKLREKFTDEIQKITWLNKISPTTLNIAPGKYQEMQVFEVILKSEDISRQVLKHIDTFVPYPILFILKRSDSVKGLISYKEHNITNNNNMTVDTYFDTGWQGDIELVLKGRSVDEIYHNFVYQIAPQLNPDINKDIKSAIEFDKEKNIILTQIEKLNCQIKNEPAIAKKQNLARERNLLEKKLGE